MKTVFLLAALTSPVAGAPTVPPPVAAPASTQDAKKEAPAMLPSPHRIDDRRIPVRLGPKPEGKAGPGIG